MRKTTLFSLFISILAIGCLVAARGDAQDAVPPTYAPTAEKATADKPAAVKSETKKAATKKSTAKKSAADKPAADKPAADKPAADKPAEDKPAADKPAEDKPATDKPATDKPAADKPVEDKPAEDKPAEDKPAEDKPAEDKPADLADTVSDLMKDEKSIEVIVSPAGTSQRIEISGSDLATMQKEIKEMHQTLSQLQETLDFLVNRVMSDLETENTQLREELQRTHGRLADQGLADDMNVPRPGRDLLEQVIKERTENAAAQAQAQAAPDEEKTPPDKDPNAPVSFSFTVIEEWGRTPEAAAQLGPNATSVKGLVGVVSTGSSKEDLMQLGRELHTKYAEFDNLNIEVFDTEAAARDYADRHITDQTHRVLSVSKHKETQRDSILLLDNGVATEVPL